MNLGIFSNLLYFQIFYFKRANSFLIKLLFYDKILMFSKEFFFLISSDTLYKLKIKVNTYKFIFMHTHKN